MQLLTLPKKTSADRYPKHADCVSNERTIVLEFYKKERENEFSINEETYSPRTMGKKTEGASNDPLPATKTDAELE